jgi:hypothetical protein
MLLSLLDYDRITKNNNDITLTEFRETHKITPELWPINSEFSADNIHKLKYVINICNTLKINIILYEVRLDNAKKLYIARKIDLRVVISLYIKNDDSEVVKFVKNRNQDYTNVYICSSGTHFELIDNGYDLNNLYELQKRRRQTKLITSDSATFKQLNSKLTSSTDHNKLYYENINELQRLLKKYYNKTNLSISKSKLLDDIKLCIKLIIEYEQIILIDSKLPPIDMSEVKKKQEELKRLLSIKNQKQQKKSAADL